MNPNKCYTSPRLSVSGTYSRPHQLRCAFVPKLWGVSSKLLYCRRLFVRLTARSSPEWSIPYFCSLEMRIIPSKSHSHRGRKDYLASKWDAVPGENGAVAFCLLLDATALGGIASGDRLAIYAKSRFGAWSYRPQKVTIQTVNWFEPTLT